MTVVFCIALILLCLTDVDAEGTDSAIVVIHSVRALTILGIGTLALLSTGWLP